MKQNNGAERKLFKDISSKQDGDRKAFEMHKKREYKINKERWKRELSMDDSTPKRQRDATLQSQKDNLKQVEAQEEQRLLDGQKSYIELEMRKFKRRKMLMLRDLESQLLRDVRNRELKFIGFSFHLLIRRIKIFHLESNSIGTQQKTTTIGTSARDASKTP